MGEWVFLSGQGGFDPETSKVVKASNMTISNPRLDVGGTLASRLAELLPRGVACVRASWLPLKLPDDD